MLNTSNDDDEYVLRCMILKALLSGSGTTACSLEAVSGIYFVHEYEYVSVNCMISRLIYLYTLQN